MKTSPWCLLRCAVMDHNNPNEMNSTSILFVSFSSIHLVFLFPCGHFLSGSTPYHSKAYRSLNMTMARSFLSSGDRETLNSPCA